MILTWSITPNSSRTAALRHCVNFPAPAHKQDISRHLRYYFGFNLHMPLRAPQGPGNILSAIKNVIAFALPPSFSIIPPFPHLSLK